MTWILGIIFYLLNPFPVILCLTKVLLALVGENQTFHEKTLLFYVCKALCHHAPIKQRKAMHRITKREKIECPLPPTSSSVFKLPVFLEIPLRLCGKDIGAVCLCMLTEEVRGKPGSLPPLLACFHSEFSNWRTIIGYFIHSRWLCICLLNENH